MSVSKLFVLLIYPMLKYFSNFQADAVLLSPPWGGVDYNSDHYNMVFNFGEEKKMDGKSLFDIVRKISENIALYVPKSSNLLQVSYFTNVS